MFFHQQWWLIKHFTNGTFPWQYMGFFKGFPYQVISGENFSQSEYVAFSAISQFAFPPLAKAIPCAFDYVNLSNLCSKQAFHSINLSNVSFIIESQSVRIHISFRQKPINKLRFEAENSTDPYAFACIDWDCLVFLWRECTMAAALKTQKTLSISKEYCDSSTS